MMSSTSSTRACASTNVRSTLDQAPESLAPARVTAGDGVDRPAGPRQRHAERGPYGSCANDPGDRRLTGFRVDVRMTVIARMDEVTVTVRAGRCRVELDAGRLERRGGFAPVLGALAVLLGGTFCVALGVVAGQVTERSHGDRV